MHITDWVPTLLAAAGKTWLIFRFKNAYNLITVNVLENHDGFPRAYG